MNKLEAANKHVYRVQSGANYTLYTKNGKKHNLNGPALKIEEDEWFYVKGENFTWNQWTDYVALYTAYEESPSIEKGYFAKASESSDGIYITVR